MSDNLYYTGLIVTMAATICFVSTQIRGCNKDGNELTASLAKQGIRAEVDPNGRVRIIDVRDWRAEKEQK
jgi:hypothetical protein